MAKFQIKKPEASSFKGWTFVLVAGVLLAFVAMIDKGGLAGLRSGADGSTGCVMRVAVDQLNVRTAPSQDGELVDTLARDIEVDAQRVVTAGFRQLEDGRWVADQYLSVKPGSTC